MSFEIHMYMAVARAETTEKYPAGERHPVLVFLRQREHAEHDFSAAESVASEAGWAEVDFTKAGILPAEAEETMEEVFRSHYRAALNVGKSLLVYETVVRPAPRMAS